MTMPVTMHKAVKYAVRRDRVTEELRTFFLKNMGCARKVWNLYTDFLYQALESAGYTGGDVPEDLQKLKLPEVSSLKEKYAYLKEADSLALANVKLNFAEAWKRFCGQPDHSSYTKRAKRRADSGTEPLSFRGLTGMPGFHAKARGYFSYTTNCQYPADSNSLKNPTIRLEQGSLILPKRGKKPPVSLVLHRPLPESWVIKNATVTMDADGRFFVSLGCEYTLEMDISLREAALADDASVIPGLRFLGLDYSNPNFYVDSEGRKANCPKSYRKSEEKSARLQRKLSRMVKGSSNYQKMQKRIARLHVKIRNQRKDFVCKEAAKLASEYDVVAVEDIDLRAMAQALHLAKNLNDNGFGMFRSRLSHKLEEKSSVLVKVNRGFASTQTCHCCGHVMKDNDHLGLAVREWDCPVCGTHHDRDMNAAINIREEGKRVFLSYYREWIAKNQLSRDRAQKRSAGRRRKKAV